MTKEQLDAALHDIAQRKTDRLISGYEANELLSELAACCPYGFTFLKSNFNARLGEMKNQQRERWRAEGEAAREAEENKRAEGADIKWLRDAAE